VKEKGSTARAKRLVCCSRCGAVYRKEYPFCPSDGAEVIETDRDPLLGSTIDHYVIEEFLGEGAMGRVYSAHHSHLGSRRSARRCRSRRA
jgi:hypothetical protein